MPVLDLLDRLLWDESERIQITVYRCRECESTFESAKSTERATCPECLADAVRPIGASE